MARTDNISFSNLTTMQDLTSRRLSSIIRRKTSGADRVFTHRQRKRLKMLKWLYGDTVGEEMLRKELAQKLKKRVTLRDL